MLLKQQFSVKYKTEISLSIFGSENGTSKVAEVQWRQVEKTVQSGKMKNFRFPMFYDQSELFKQESDNIVTTKKM